MSIRPPRDGTAPDPRSGIGRVTPASSQQPERVTPGVARFVLALGYLCLASLYAWQASKRVSPTIFSDEIEFTQISRGIAENGVPSRRGEPSGFGSLYTYLVAPAWWLDPKAAWEAAKLIGVLVMTATIVPAYGLARFVVSRPWALAAALIAVAAPPLAYAPYLLEEPLAYPVSTAALWAIAAAVAQPTRRRLVLAGALCLVAPFVRGELAVLLAVFGAGLFMLLWRTERFARWRATWTVGDWVGAATLVAGVAVVFSAAAGHRSDAWYVATGFEKQRVLDYGTWSLAAMTIGLGVLPIIATVAAFLSSRLRATREGRAFVVVGVAAFASFLTYAAVKGTFLSTNFANLIVERNVIYLVPVALAATAAVLARRIATLPALTVGLVVVVYLVLNAELRLDQYPYFEAPSLAIGALANRNFAWDPGDVERALVWVALGSVLILAARSLIRSRTTGLAVAVVAACAVTTWTLTTEIYAARGLNSFAERLHGSTAQPVDWVDQATGGESTLYLGQQINDANTIWLLEFWNYSIDKVWSLDGTAPVPSLSPDLGDTDGSLSPDPGVNWVVTGNGVEVVGERIGEPRGNMTLFRVTPPVRFRYAQNGVSTDGWMGEHASYSQYAPDEGVSRGYVRVVLSRQGACGANVPPANVVVRVGTVAVRDKQPGFGHVQEVARRTLEPCALQPVVLRATVPYHVEVTVSPTFVPAELDPGSGDVRELGAQVRFDFLPRGAEGG
jgi:hypothetical protein